LTSLPATTALFERLLVGEGLPNCHIASTNTINIDQLSSRFLNCLFSKNHILYFLCLLRQLYCTQYLKMAERAFVFNDASRSGDSEREYDFDFVFIEKEFECRTTDDDDEDDVDSYDSYDYCEDVISIISNSNEQENDSDVYLLSDSIDDEMTSPTTCLKYSALSVPLVLLKDLDEAHAAAKLTFTDLERFSDLVTTCSDDEQGIEVEENYAFSSHSQHNYTLEETEKEKPKELERSQMTKSSSTLSNDSNDCTGIEDSSSLVLYTKASEPNATAVNGNSAPRNRAIIILPVAETGKNPSPSEITLTMPCFLLTNFSQKERTKKEEKHFDDKKANSMNNVVKASSGPIAISRTSNKKRRKKLKLMKKAQAADKFQHQVAFANLSSLPQGKISKKLLKHSKKQQHLLAPPRCVSKKVANIAVSCAIESMSCYREELSRQQGTT
jgi:hypothetical protein